MIQLASTRLGVELDQPRAVRAGGGCRRGFFLLTVAGPRGLAKKKSTRPTVVFRFGWRPTCTVVLVHPKSLGARKAAVLSKVVVEEEESQQVDAARGGLSCVPA
jgi:hypothetical protein